MGRPWLGFYGSSTLPQPIRRAASVHELVVHTSIRKCRQLGRQGESPGTLRRADFALVPDALISAQVITIVSRMCHHWV